MATNAGQLVMLSYNHKSASVVKTVFEHLKAENIPVWFDERDMHDNMYTRYASQWYSSFSSILIVSF